ncbi:G-protein coupled receptor 20 [Hyla sarda]|uniref:G-protein coupled receptor 20 n=1 Tax=Hyla sarda TaxID=327740 RepID=UPI0024C384B6|nr:G-protein coupled receptor 20 [Hyla sarda]XP_056374630.1 G-protein coupled receptor 20 [Hyla sarda]XP_056374631.1 G-protein coupled receptor 20 [Hyla sarda]XP_056374632.1 G-protein coupled receptor 20 [Hyla sarda]XP_056374633.1 G-protein coupled receptor 20 [Hyla sarda]XP_056374634.1 G-protein coupled receptor 20 [Hyla sarda]XP_056374636.1 G-protein coupled receptor 20 [Hyla sarda]XP_056374637.1 G-protein coupled receptor 20 [Hyla sarda]
MECLLNRLHNTTGDQGLNTSLANTQKPQANQLADLDETLHNRFYGLWVALLIINTLIFLVGIILNSLAIYVFCFRTKAKTTSVIYTINLIVTDLLVGLSLPTRIVMYYSAEACPTCSFVHSFTYFVNMYCSILFLTCICVDRYMAIVQVEASRKWRSPNYAKCICIFIWIFAVVVTFTILTTTINHPLCCQFQLFTLTVFEYFVPLIIITFYTLRIMWALSRSTLMNQSRERRMKAVQLLITVLIIFTVCFTPIHVSQVVFCASTTMSRDVILIVYHVTVTLSSLNSCMDPIVYCFVTNNFQSTMRSIFRKHQRDQTSMDILGLHKNSKASGTMTAISNAIVTLPLQSSNII